MTDTNKVDLDEAEIDLDEAEKRAAGFRGTWRGTWRAMSYDSGDEVLEFVAEGADPAGDVDEIAQFACDDETQRAVVATLNDAPALIAEVRSMRNDRVAVAAMLRVSVQNGEMTDKLIETSHRLMDEIASLRHKLAKAKRLGLKACSLVNGSEFAAIAAALESLDDAAASAGRTSVHEALGVSPQDAARAAMAHGVPCPTCGAEKVG